MVDGYLEISARKQSQHNLNQKQDGAEAFRLGRQQTCIVTYRFFCSVYIAKTLEFLPLRLGQLHAYLRILALINTVNSTFHGGWNCLFPNSYASIELGSSVLHLFDSPHFLGILLSQTKFNTECLFFFFCHLESTLCFFTSARLIFFLHIIQFGGQCGDQRTKLKQSLLWF